MTYQRSRGLMAYIWKVTDQVDSRSNAVVVPVRDDDNPVKVWVMASRGSKAEVPGQQHINVIRLGTDIIDGLEFWSRVEVLGKTWDVVEPPQYHKGTRNTAHYSFDVRERTGG